MRLQILSVLALASIAGCSTSNGPNAVYDGGISIGRATFGGSALGLTAVTVGLG